MSYKKGEFFVPEEQLISLVEGAKQGDKQAQGEIYLTFVGYLSRYIATKVPYEKVDELVTNTILDAYDGIHQLSEPAALPWWLRSIAHNKIYHFHKNREREKKREQKRERKEAQERLREIRRTSGIDLSRVDIQNAVNTLYTDNLVFHWNGNFWESNSERDPTVVFNHIEADGKDYHKYINGDEIRAGVRDIRYFRIKMAGMEKAAYQYEFGMTMGQWVNSKYNTGGWKRDTKDPYIVTSADGRYKLNKDDYCWREMTAELYGPIPRQ